MILLHKLSMIGVLFSCSVVLSSCGKPEPKPQAISGEDALNTDDGDVLPKIPTSLPRAESAALLEARLNTADLKGRSGMLGRAAKEMDAGELPSILALMKAHLDGSQLRGRASTIFRRLAKEDPSVGRSLLDGFGPGSIKTALIESFYSSLEPQDVIEYANSVAQFGLEDERKRAFASLKGPLSKLPAEDLIGLFTSGSTSDPSLKRFAADAYGRAVGKTGVSAIVDQLAGIPSDFHRAVLNSWAAEASSIASPERVLDTLEVVEGEIDESVASQVVATTAHTYASASPGEAATWAAKIEDPDHRSAEAGAFCCDLQLASIGFAGCLTLDLRNAPWASAGFVDRYLG